MNLKIATSMIAVALVAAACTSSEDRQAGIVPAAADLPQPNVVMEADPPPPFTYWAPDGSTIRNHPRIEDVWIAEVADGQDRYYFGDQCHASRYQQFVGRPLADMPPAPEGSVWRIYCSTCAATSDLGFERLNVNYEEQTRKIVSISCG